MTGKTETRPYESNDIALLREVVESAERRLEAQLTAALAADQRALVLGGFLGAAIVALVGGSLTLWLAEPRQAFLALTGLACALGFLLALFLTTYAARPTDWNYPGTRPEAWRNDIAASKPENERLRELCADLKRKTGENAEIMRTNGRAIVRSLAVSALSLTVSGAALVGYFVCNSG